MCPKFCSACIGTQCCPSNSIILGDACICPVGANCTCSDGYELISHNSLKSCIPISFDTREYKITSQPGLEINCIETGSGIAISSKNGNVENDITDSDFI